MNRCVLGSARPLAALLCTLLALAQAPAQAQMPRPFPATALRGTLQITQPPEALINGQPARLAPGARIRDEQNLVQLSGRFVGQSLVVHYTLENGTGLLKDLWILRPDELAKKPWPATPAEAAAWRFDALAQTWTKP